MMAKQRNGTLGLILKIIGLLLACGSILVGGALAFKEVDAGVGANTVAIDRNTEGIESVKDGIEKYIWPEVKLNSHHRTTDEVDTPYIKRDIEQIKKNQENFQAEQRMVNQELLRRLPE